MAPLKKLAFLLLLSLLAATAAAATYTNHTVGGPAGWFFNATTETPSSNYATWAKGLTFNLGDYLIFNTNTNQTVVQTYNATSYKSCNADDDDTVGDVSIYSGGDGFGVPAVLAVPLIKVGPNYYFSDADDGAQCEKGMKFEIVVKQGSGLPPSLNQPPPPPFVEPPAQTPPESSSGTGAGQEGAGSDGNGCSKTGFGFGFVAFVALISGGFVLL